MTVRSSSVSVIAARSASGLIWMRDSLLSFKPEGSAAKAASPILQL